MYSMSVKQNLLIIFWPHFTRREALVVASEKTFVEVNAEKLEYVVMSRDQNAGKNHNIKMGNTSVESVANFVYLGTTPPTPPPPQKK
jgi:hypothetical protein